MNGGYMEEKKYKVIFNQRLAGYLMMHGFILVKIEPDRDGSGRNVFLFHASNELTESINQYKKCK